MNYVKSYKLNNSYTVYIIPKNEDFCNTIKHYYYPVNQKLEWKPGAKVSHYRHGIGVIKSISKNSISVNFNASKISRKPQNIQVSFEFKNNPKEIESLKLCIWQKEKEKNNE